MTSMPEVIARLRAALTGLRPEELREIHQHLTENVQPLLAELAAETTNPDLAVTPELLAGALTAIGNAADLYDHATDLTHSYIADHEATEAGSTATATKSIHVIASITDGTAGAGHWKGQTAADHARSEGKGIGRKPRGSKKRPIREVRSTEELLEIFNALSRGGTVLDLPRYDGVMVLLPDATKIGYRTKSTSSPDPTIGIRTEQDVKLKIHVNREGWMP